MFRKIHIYFTLVIASVFLLAFVDSSLRLYLASKPKAQRAITQEKLPESNLIVISSDLKQELDELSKYNSEKKTDLYENKIQSYARHLESDEIDQLADLILSKNAPLNLRQLSKEILDRNQSDYAEKKRAEIDLTHGIE